MTTLRRRVLPAVLALALLLALPALVGDAVLIRVLTTACLFAVLAASWDLLSGFTGQVTFGHAAFVGIGGYATALFASETTANPALALLIGPVCAALFGLVIGIPALRLQGPYLALATLAAASALYQLIFVFKDKTRGEDGISGLTTLDETAVIGDIGRFIANILGGQGFESARPLARAAYTNYFLVVLIAGAVLLLMCWFGYGRHGVVLRSIGQEETAAQAAGVPIARYKVAAFTISGGCAGLIGALMVLTRGSASTDLLALDLSLIVIVMAAIGGTGSLIGPAGGAFVIILLQDHILELIPMVEAEPAYKQLTFALLLILVLRFLPHGLFGSLQETILARKRSPVESPLDSASVGDSPSEFAKEVQ